LAFGGSVWLSCQLADARLSAGQTINQSAVPTSNSCADNAPSPYIPAYWFSRVARCVSAINKKVNLAATIEAESQKP